jgi:hypothetical protein
LFKSASIVSQEIRLSGFCKSFEKKQKEGEKHRWYNHRKQTTLLKFACAEASPLFFLITRSSNALLPFTRLKHKTVFHA